MTQNTHRAVRAADSSLRFRVLLIGASTGGPQALRCVLSGIGADFPLPVLITQHIDASFAASFPQWLTETTGLSVQLARAHTAAQAGCVYVAPPERHLIVRRAAAGGFVLAFDDGPPVEFVKPSIDMLFFLRGAGVCRRLSCSAADRHGKRRRRRLPCDMSRRRLHCRRISRDVRYFRYAAGGDCLRRCVRGAAVAPYCAAYP